jgi:hypothetical protein
MVVLASLIGLGLMIMAGAQGTAKLQNGINAVAGRRGRTDSNKVGITGLTPEVFVGWAVLFVMFIVLTDIPATEDIGTAFAWLLLLSIALTVGPDAFHNITNIVSGGVPTNPTPPAPSGQGGQIG